MNSRLAELLTEHNLKVRDIGAQYHIAPSTLSGIYSRPVSDWPVGVLKETSVQLGLSIDALYEALAQSSKALHPFIKWVGGKRQLLSQIDQYLPEAFNTYYEPFLGGGAVFLHLKPTKSIVNDFNNELINTWQVVKNHDDDLKKLTTEYKEKNSKEFYMWVRLADRDGRIENYSDVERAARFLYLNKTGFNGLWRVNRAGQNNVPYGKYSNPTVYDPIIDDVSEFLNASDVTITQGDYRESLVSANQNDFVYLDSPYDTVSKTASFTSYTKGGFGTDDQEALRDEYVRMTNLGVKVMESNADTNYINQLYQSIPGVRIIHITARRAINSKGNKRGPVGEVLILNY